MDELATLSGDFLFERRRLADSLRRLESLIVSPEVSTQIGRATLIEMQAEIDRLTSGIFRLDALAKHLSAKSQFDRYEDCDFFLNSMVVAAQNAASTATRAVLVNATGHGTKVDRHKISKLQEVLPEMMQTFIEFSIESPKERRLRGKKETAFVQMGMRRHDEGIQFTLVADGNGVMPPLSDEHGERLAAIGVRATFQGKPGKWSCWVFNIPHYAPVMNCYAVSLGGLKVYMPATAVVAVHDSGPLDPGETPIIRMNNELKGEVVRANEVRAGPVHALEVAAGSRRAWLLIDGPAIREEVFMKPVPESLSGYGRYMGMVVSTTAPSQALFAVINPSFIVYGGTLP